MSVRTNPDTAWRDGCRHRRRFSTPLMAIEPIVDHRMSQPFRLLAVASYDFPGAFNTTGMNGYAPVVAFDPGADGVPDASVFHQGVLRSNGKPSNHHHGGASAP